MRTLTEYRETQIAHIMHACIQLRRRALEPRLSFYVMSMSAGDKGIEVLQTWFMLANGSLVERRGVAVCRRRNRARTAPELHCILAYITRASRAGCTIGTVAVFVC